MLLPRLLVVVTVLWSSVAAAQVRAPVKPVEPKPAAQPEAPALKFEIGKETTIDQPGLVDGHFILYVPSDYTPERAWPMIFCYHGINQSAKVWPFKELTDGKGYIVVGMSYVTKNGADTDKEWDSLVHIGQLVAGTLKVNPRMVFIGGFSLGGGWTYRLAAKNPSAFAGVAAFGMHGSPGASSAAWQGKPVLIAHGEKDEYCQTIQSTLDAFQKVGAQVTHEVFQGQGHMVDTRNAVCKKWLLDNGPLKAVRADLEAARGLEKSGKIGAALAMYEAIAKVEGGGEYAQAAQQSARTMTEAAEKQLAAAEEAIAAKKYSDAVRALAGVEKTYAGASPAEKANTRLEAIQSDPQIKAAIAQARVDATADALEAQALAAENAKDFGRALAIYEKYLESFPNATRAAAVKTHVATLQADESITTAVAAKQMDKDCKSWMSLADSYTKAGLRSKAKGFLQRIIDKYPDSDYAETARQKLDAMR